MRFSEVLESYEEQATEGECSADWIEHFYLAVKEYFSECEENGTIASIKELKATIIKRAKVDDFGFK